jgi:hypothetical protein
MVFSVVLFGSGVPWFLLVPEGFPLFHGEDKLHFRERSLVEYLGELDDSLLEL